MSEVINDQENPVTEQEEQVEQQPENTEKTEQTEQTQENSEEDSTDTSEKSSDPSETKEEKESADDPESSTEEPAGYPEYTDPALKQATNLLKEANVSVEDANAIFKEAVETGDLSKIDTGTLVEKLGEDKAELVQILAEKYYSKAQEQVKETKELVHGIVGNEETFKDMQKWAAEKESQDPSFAKDLEDFRNMIDTGQPRSIKAAISELFDMYKADPNTTIRANLEVGDKAASTAGLTPMTRREYVDALEKARKEGTFDTQSATLWQRRLLGKKQGI